MKTSDLIIAIAVAGMWGFNFSVIKLGVSEMDPLILTGLRFTFAALPAVFFIAKPNVPWSILAGYGLTFGVGVWGMMTLSIHHGVSAGMAGLILQSSTFISVVLGVVVLKERLTFIQVFGLIISIFGLLLIFNLEDGSVTLIGLLLALFGAFSLSSISLLLKKVKIQDMFAFVVWSCLFVPLPIFALSTLLNGGDRFIVFLDNVTSLGMFSVFFQAYPVTILGYWLWNNLIVKYPMSLMAPLTLLVPIFGILGSILFYDEPFDKIKLLACFLILAGVAIGFVEQLLRKYFQKKSNFAV